MKKIILTLFSLLLSGLVFAQSYKYQITNVEYDISGCGPKFLGTTKSYALEKNVPVNRTQVFETKDALDQYIKDYEVRLNNTRAFESIVVTLKYEVSENQAAETVIPVTLFVKVKDSLHLLGLPYPKYSSNDGFTLKLKIKDTNFLGTLNEMNTAVNFSLESKEGKDSYTPAFGLEFDFDFPFKAGPFDSTWVNNYAFSYTVGDSSPEWKTKTGFDFELPGNRVSYILSVYQSFIRNEDYLPYNDRTYAGEEIKFSVPVIIAEIPNFSPVKYTPYLDFVANWDLNGINIENTALSSPYLTFGHSFSINRVNWENRLRTGVNASLSNTFKYNFQRKMLYPEIAMEVKAYKSFNLFPTKDFMNRFGVCADIYSFVDIYDYNNIYFKNDGTNIGSRMRGYRDYQKFKTSGYNGWYSLQTPAAIVVNLDFPVHIFQTNFQSKFMKYLNFDFQLSPFVDVALTYNKATKEWFNPKDGLYAGGLEVLVYPLKWSSFTVRGSVGVDLGRYLLSSKLNTDWRQNVSKYEISFGIGLQY